MKKKDVILVHLTRKYCCCQADTVVSDTKAEIARLFGSVPTPKPDTKKKDANGAKKKRVVVKPPPPPQKSKEEKELDSLEKEGAWLLRGFVLSLW